MSPITLLASLASLLFELWTTTDENTVAHAELTAALQHAYGALAALREASVPSLTGSLARTEAAQ